MNKQIIIVRDKLKHKLTPKRYEHTIGVMYTCASLAMKYNYDINKAMWAGLLHDCAKNYSDEEMLKKCNEHNIAVTASQMRAPYLLHGKLGAFYAKNKYGVDDDEILNAIEYHTTGRPGMGTLECILFIADYIEPGRNEKEISGLDKVRDCAFNIGLRDAVVMKLENIIGYLNSITDNMDEMTLKTYNYFKEKK